MIMNYWQNSPTRLLFTWTRWLFLHHPTLRLVNITLPLLGLGACMAVGLILPAFNITKEYGLIQQANGLLQILAPFFVAALALVAGFPGEALDFPMGGISPYLIVAGETYIPSRRELLGYLFAYLAALSVLTYLGGGIVVAASNPSPQYALIWLGTVQHGYIGICLKATYGAILIHLFGITLLGLHFLGNFLTSSRNARESRPSSTEQPPLGPPAASPQPPSISTRNRESSGHRIRRIG